MVFWYYIINSIRSVRVHCHTDDEGYAVSNKQVPDESLLFPLLGLPLASAMVGTILGFGITMAAWAVDTWWQGAGFSIRGVWVVHGKNPLHIFLDVAPIAGGAIGYALGVARGRLTVMRDRALAFSRSQSRDSTWRRVMSAAPDGLLIVDKDTVVIHVNPAAERVLGRRASMLIGMRVDELIQNAHRLREENAFDLRTGLGAHLGTAWKTLAKHGSGALVPCIVSIHKLGSEAHAPHCYRIRDVSVEPKRHVTPPSQTLV
ncbi:MAG: PAS domain S-box-containing protein [Myxococcota bacterium]